MRRGIQEETAAVSGRLPSSVSPLENPATETENEPTVS